MRVISCLFTQHNLWLVGVAAVVCVAGSFITFNLLARIRNRRGIQMHGWAFLTAVAAGSSIWCTHFVAMLAYEVTAPVTFDPILTMASLLIAIVGCGLGFGLSALRVPLLTPMVCGAIVGLSVACMHYTGMAAYHVAGFVEWDEIYVAISLVIAATLSAVALDEATRQPREHSWLIAPALFVVAIVGLHFTGMTAVQVTPMLDSAAIASTEAYEAMAVAVAGVGLIVIGTGAASYLIDETSSQESVAKLQHMALNDALTGLPNRTQFGDYLASELQRARERHGQLAVIGIDLDRFKEINDQRGHDAGDRALALIGKRLATLAKPGEFVARIGGDEFSAVKRYDDLNEVHEFISRIDAALNELLEFHDFQASIGGSIGIALFPDDGIDPDRLIANADLAMYRAKAHPERNSCFYERQMDEAARSRSVLAADLRLAIARNELELHYQVQHELSTRDVTGYEVLLRWNHAEHGKIPPTVFIPIAEETGSISEIGEWVLRTACREAATWTTPSKIAVNVSAVQLRHGDLAHLIHCVLLETGLPASQLEIEITETSIIEDRVRALHVLRRVRALGVTVAIDDFGIGYSSLETLRAFPFDKIKLDQSFTNGLEHDIQAMAIVRAVLALGKSLHIKVLAEGVETYQQLLILRSEGCDEAQGYYLGRPQRRVVSEQPGHRPALASA